MKLDKKRRQRVADDTLERCSRLCLQQCIPDIRGASTITQYGVQQESESEADMIGHITGYRSRATRRRGK